MQEERRLLSNGKVLSQKEINILNALPLVRRIAEFRLRGSYREAAEDIVQKVGLNLWRWSLVKKDSSHDELQEESQENLTEELKPNGEEMNGEDWLRVAQVVASREINSFFRSKYRKETRLSEAALENELFGQDRNNSSAFNWQSQSNNSFNSSLKQEGNSRAEMTSILRQVWKIIMEMTLRQKYALLLQKDELIINLLTHGCCSREEIAGALACTKAEFDIIFTSFPLTDEAIRHLIEKKINGEITLHQVWMARGKAKAKLEARIRPLIE